MRTSLLRTVVMVAALTVASGANAVDVVNQDGEEHLVVVNEGGTESEHVIPAGGSVPGVCGTCTIEVEGGGKTEAAGDEVVVIKDGNPTKGS